ncbi:helix-turn-helix domain-containing protein [Citrobacter freundii]|uniref:helix-turn-helix domain-containing protein n=1 Tax=Citrobacter freundii TaxID=546 RepID=UPI0015E9188B|nr:helix-turn-helix domain-containing protein [Citrobacter freundii]QLZ59920.1 helix-turn-helix domain-containing protein [Citrobacter freundii]
MSKYNPNQFYKFDVRISQLSEEINAAARLIYMVMVHSCDFYEEKYKAYSPSIDHLAYMAGVSKRTAIRAIETLEKHGLIQVQKNQGRQSTYRVFTLDDKPELLVRPTSQEVAASIRQNDTTTSDKMSSVPVTKCHGGSDKMSPVLDKLLDKTLDNNIIDKSKDAELNDGIKEDDFLSLDESDFDSDATKEASKASDLEEGKNSDVINISDSDSDQQDTPCRPESTDDELPDVDLGEESPEEALRREQHKAAIRAKFQKAKAINKNGNELPAFNDYYGGDDDDDFSFTPKKKVLSENKKQKIKPKMYYAGGGIQ